MINIKLILRYHGKRFSGFQSQSTGNTVEDIIADSLAIIYKKKVLFVAAGRTDAGVHAIGQVISFQADESVPVDRIPKAINAVLPNDIRILSAEQVENIFHARYLATSRSYRYLFSADPIPFYLEDVIVPISFQPSLAGVQELKSYMIGEHDFSVFQSSGSSSTTTRRCIYQFSIDEIADYHIYSQCRFHFYCLNICANGFLYRMVRNIMGALFEVLQSRRTVDEFKWMMANKKRNYYFKTAPARGLCLTNVTYT